MKKLPLLALVLFLTACSSKDDVFPEDDPGANLSPQQTVDCSADSWFGGSLQWCAGTLIYRDYVFDDYGADKGFLSPHPSLANLNTRAGQIGNPFATTPGLLSPTAGDVQYPAGAQSTADLVSLTLSRDGAVIKVKAELNALYAEEQTILALAVDSDGDSSTSDQNLLGLRVEGADVVYTFTKGNPETNVIEGEFELPSAELWRVWAVTAQSNGEVMNVAFRGMGEGAGATGGIPDQVLPGLGNWWEDLQAAALAGGDITRFAVSIDSNDFVRGRNTEVPVAPGFYQRVYVSDYTVPGSTGEGMVLDGLTGRENRASPFCGQYFNFVGKYQPYGIYIPSAIESGQPLSLQVVMHGCEANHASQINQRGMQRQFGENLNRILVAPLGRGPYGFYSDLSERDVLDVMQDALDQFNIDEDRVFSSGYSMGGYGALRMAALYPHLFAGVNNWVGFTGSLLNTPLPGNLLVELENQFRANGGDALPLNSEIGAVGNIINYLGNLRNIAGTHSYAALDELVQIHTGLALGGALDATGNVVYEFFMHLPAEHLTLIALDEWTKEADYTRELRRNLSPAHVTFKTRSLFDFPEYGLIHDRAYWVKSLEFANTEQDLSVDLHSSGCESTQPVFQTGQSGGISPVPYVQTYRRIAAQEQVQSAPKLTGRLQNVSSFLLDLQEACLSPGDEYDLTVDAPVTMKQSNGQTLELTTGRNTGRLR